MAIPVPMPTIDDFHFQIFCFNQYREREGHKDLTDMQKRVRTVMRRFDGDMVKAAKYMGVTPQNIQGHVSLIKSKGWSI